MFRKIAFKIAKPVAGGIQDEEAEKAREEEKKKDVVKLGAPVKKEQKRSNVKTTIKNILLLIIL